MGQWINVLLQESQDNVQSVQKECDNPESLASFIISFGNSSGHRTLICF